MANHAFLISSNIPSDPEIIDKDLREFVNARFPILNIIRNENQWLVTHTEEPTHHAVNFWLNRLRDWFSDDEEMKDLIEPNSLCLEFRHGHGPELYWWIEKEIRQFFSEKYQIKLAYDEGIGKYEESGSFPTLSDYMKHLCWCPDELNEEERKAKLEQSYLIKMSLFKRCMESEMFPKTFLPYIGEDLENIPDIDVVFK